MYVCLYFTIDLSLTHVWTPPISHKMTKSPTIRVLHTQNFHILPIKTLLPTNVT